MDESQRLHRLTERMRSGLAKMGGKLSGLNPEQKWKRKRNNDSSGEGIPTPERETIMSSEAAAKAIGEDVNNKVPPAGGSKEQVAGELAIKFFSKALDVVEADARRAPRTWKETAVNTGIYSGGVVVAVVGIYAGRALVDRWVRKPVAAPAQLPENTTPMQMSASPSGVVRAKVG